MRYLVLTIRSAMAEMVHRINPLGWTICCLFLCSASLGEFTQPPLHWNDTDIYFVMILHTAETTYSNYFQVKEVGTFVTSCHCLVQDANKLFEVYWYLGNPGTPIPDPWPSHMDTEYNKETPMEIELNNTASSVYMSVRSITCK